MHYPCKIAKKTGHFDWPWLARRPPCVWQGPSRPSRPSWPSRPSRPWRIKASDKHPDHPDHPDHPGHPGQAPMLIRPIRFWFLMLILHADLARENLIWQIPVGWGGMLTFLVLRTWYIAMLPRSPGSFTTLHVATLLMGCGGVFVHDILPCCRDLRDRLLRYMLLRCWWGAVGSSYMKYCYAAEISGIVYYVTCCYAAESGIWWKSQFPATWVPKVTSWWCMLELGNGDAFTRMLTASW